MKGLSFLSGWLPVASKEGRASILSPRLIIIAAILALAVLAGTYFILPGGGGGGGTPSRFLVPITYFEQLNTSRPAMALFAYTPTGNHLPGVEIQLVNLTGGLREPENLDVLESNSTDASGWVRFEGLWARYPDHELGLGLAEDPGAIVNVIDTHERPGGPAERFPILHADTFPLGGSFDRQTLFLVFVDIEGILLSGADVFIWRVSEETCEFVPRDVEPPGGWVPYRNGTTDESGFYFRPEPLGEGAYVVRAAKGELNETASFCFFGTPSPLSLGPDGVLAFVGLAFLPLILPIMALVLAYDVIARERSEGSLDLLLSKPVSRIGVALGKLIGVFGSMAVPVIAILLVAAVMIWSLTGQPPTGTFLASFLGTVLLLLLAYTLVFLAVSSNVRNLGTALLVSILLFLLFAFFWGVISFVVAGLFATPGSVRWFEIIVALSLATPTGVYQQLLSLSLLGIVVSFFGPIGSGPQPVPLLWIGAAAIVWIVFPFTLFLLAMKYRVTEG